MAHETEMPIEAWYPSVKNMPSSVMWILEKSQPDIESQ